MRFGEGAADIPYYLKAPDDSRSVPQGVTDPSQGWAPYDPNIALQPAGETPYYLAAPTRSFTELLSEYKWWLIGGGALFLAAGGSILGLSLRKRRRSRR